MQRPPAVRVLIVEDDSSIRSALEEALREEGYQVWAESNASRLRQVQEKLRPDIAILDVRLPGINGYEAGRQLREASDVALLFLTAADRIEDRLAGFEAGADDYMVKPFAIAELLARVRALLRRSGKLSARVRRIGDLEFDDENAEVARAGTPLHLTPTEYGLLVALAKKPGKLISKIQLLNEVWGFSDYAPNIVEVHVSSLRQKLEEHGPRIIRTARGRGYALDV
ncbi:MAG TPA: response regulator transcription factor [Acidimicrobiales bacterium]|nr:response regulator transcription factor [Acidimicrobiales bacterium]